MKFALNVVTLYVIASMVPKTAPIQPFSDASRNFVLDVSANDHIWAKHLDVGIKFDPKNLSAAGRRVLVDLNVLKTTQAVTAIPVHEHGEEQTPGAEQTPGMEQTPYQEPVDEQQQGVLVARALHIVIEVATHYNTHGMALDFALDSMAKAIKCKTLTYILVQLYAIKKTQELQNDAITSQPSEVWNTLVHVLDKVAVLRESIDEEFELYQRWEVVATQVKAKDLPPDFEVFQNLVEKTLDKSCELCQFEQIKKHIQVDGAEIWESAVDTMKIFMKCQALLKEMFKEIPISTMNMKVWEHFLNKPEFIEPSEPSLPTEA
ncbi:unnamed protein product [Macrosiphum euphorbiae]|uniref:Uncharacterized protein n=1 Tax=Macrosiphum euphorbiae TaxID=13131 RepID=A0AAV0XLY8_9HEMI|nr:unnamed protein product [Macrosiphum euphorbiae]